MLSGHENETRFRILVPVWGERYIRDFCAIALPALLADGNLPALTRAAPCEIVFLTTRASQAFFEGAEGIRRIRDVCPYSFTFIDDLLPLESYGIILTAAYGRGIASLGALQTSTYFIFLNADFVLSNGILRSVVDRIGKGYRAVMAPSLRCKQEEVVDDLQKRVSHRTGTLDAAPRDLVRLTLDSLHLTARASIVNQPLAHHNAANQFFWRVDDDTLIGRFFLLFMLCIRPERPFTTCVGWCDYTFVPELVPSGNYDVLVDSDDGFILEMQARRGEAHHIRAGRLTPKAFAPRLSFWTTAHHRAYAGRTILLHAGEVPARVEAVKAEADAFMADLFSHMAQPPTSHLRHPYWASGLLHFQDNLPANAMPPELPRFRMSPLESARQIFGRRNPPLEPIRRILNRWLVGVPPKVGRLHFAYLDYENFAAQIAALRGQCRNPLHVRERPSPIDAYLGGACAFTTVALADLDKRRSDDDPFDGAVITLMDYTLYKLPRFLRLVAAHCADGAPVLICIDAIEGIFFGGRFTVYGDTIELMAADIPAPVAIDGYSLITAPERLNPAYRLVKLREMVDSRSLSALMAAVITAPPAFARIFQANLRNRPEAASSPGICTSATIHLRGPWRSMTRAQAVRATEFDPAFYNRINPDVAQAGIDPEAHFFEYGWKEKRDPSAFFSVDGYLDANPDVSVCGTNPLLHFRAVGLAEGRNGWQR